MNAPAPLRRRALGRGLDALIPGNTPARGDYFVAPIEDIHPTPDQPRKVFDAAKLEELAQSIRASGVIQPLVVRERKATEGGGYWLIAGERRWRASQKAGLHELPVIVREASPAAAFELALVENLQRADLDSIEEAQAYQRLTEEFGYTQERLAERVGKDRTTISNILRLLKLPTPVMKLVHDGALSMGHARALLGLEDSAAIETMARTVAAKSMSVRATEDLVRRGRPASGNAEPAKQNTPANAASLLGGTKGSTKSPNVKDLEQRLARTLGARVKIVEQAGGKAGKIEIPYASLDDLDRILERLYTPHR